MAGLIRSTMTSLLMAVLMASMVLSPVVCMAEIPIPGFYGEISGMDAMIQGVPAGALPELDSIVSGASRNPSTSGNDMTVYQDQAKAVFQWKKFNVGEDATVRFDQGGNTDWVALNKILDANPSLVLGGLSADGKVYMINANGILFGKNSKINVHSLVASTLEIPEDLVDGINFTTLDATTEKAVTNLGEITAKTGGTVILVGPVVENAGTIDAPQGKIMLLGGTRAAVQNGDVTTIITDESDPDGDGTSVTPKAYNLREGESVGRLYADEGLVRMMGRSVNQDGVIRSVSTVENQGKIHLVGTKSVNIGSQSQILATAEDYNSGKEFSELEGGLVDIRTHYKSDADKKGTADDNSLDSEIEVTTSADFDSQNVGRVSISGIVKADAGTITVKSGGDVTVADGAELDASATDFAPGGTVAITSTQGAITVDRGAEIDISGRDLGEYDYLDKSKLTGDERDQFISEYGDFPDLEALKNSLNAGSLKINAPEGNVVLNGKVSARGGEAIIRTWKPSEFVISESASFDAGGKTWQFVQEEYSKGSGGSTDYTALAIDDFETLHQKMTGAGFDQRLDYTAMTGDFRVGRDLFITGSDISLAATAGVLEFDGTALASKIHFLGQSIDFGGVLVAVRSHFQEANIAFRSDQEIITSKDSLIRLDITDDPTAYEKGFSLAQGTVSLQSDNSYINHEGKITNPGGKLSMTAASRITLGTESVIDVSGNWVKYDSSSLMFDVSLTSNELRDEYQFKDGLLFGEDITINKLSGSSIGDLSDVFWNAKVAALEHPDSVKGGEIVLTAEEVVAKTGSEINISGGGYDYAPGQLETTYLLFGRTIYSLDDENVAHWLPYAKLVGSHVLRHERFGVLETWDGLYAGSPVRFMDQFPGYKEGHNAGELYINAGTIALDGTILANAYTSRFQTAAYIDENVDDSNTSGLREPEGGTIILGEKGTTGEFADRTLGDVEIVENAEPVADDLGADPTDAPLPVEREGKTILSAGTITNSGASSLSILSNKNVSIGEGAKIALAPAGRALDGNNEATVIRGNMFVMAQNILHEGEIVVPGGSVTMMLEESSEGALPVQRIFLGNNSLISVAGMKYDVRDESASYPVRENHLQGGNVTLAANTSKVDLEGIIVKQGAVIDVSGGHEAHNDGAVYGADAGKIHLEGPNVILDGDAKGMSLEGYAGGELSIYTDAIEVGTKDSLTLGNVNLLRLPDRFNNDDALTLENIVELYGITGDDAAHLIERINTTSGALGFDSLADPTTTYIGADYIEDKGFSTLTLRAMNVEVLDNKNKADDLVLALDLGDENLDLSKEQGARALIDELGLQSVATDEQVSELSGLFSSVTLNPSTLKERVPDKTDYNGQPVYFGVQDVISRSGQQISGEDTLVNEDFDYLGPSGIRLLAGDLYERSADQGEPVASGTVTMPANFRIELSPDSGSTAEISASGPLAIRNVISAPGGTISISSSDSPESNSKVVVYKNARLLAHGKTIQSREPKYAEYGQGIWLESTPIGGGTISITGDNSGISVKKGAVLDVSGTEDGVRYLLDKELNVQSRSVYAGPGTLKLNYKSSLEVDGTVLMDNLSDKEQWGELVLNRSELLDMQLSGEVFDAFEGVNYGDLTIKSLKSIAFNESVNIDLPGKVVLNAPEIKAWGDNPGNVSVNVDAAWLQVRNDSSVTGIIETPDSIVDGRQNDLGLNANWIDLQGHVAVSGFSDVTLEAGVEITTEDKRVNVGLDTKYLGKLTVANNLVLNAPRIYPLMHSGTQGIQPSLYTFKAREDVSIGYGSAGPGDVEAPIYSAMGKLTVQGKNIYHEGFLAAPMGTVELKAIPDFDGVNYQEGVIELAEGSRIRVGGYDGVPINYGKLSGVNWTKEEKTVEADFGEVANVTIQPEKRVILSGNQVIGKEGAFIEGQGGGSIYAYEFLQSVEGSKNPLTKEGSYVVVPAEEYNRPGEMVYLEGIDGLESGYYNVMDPSYAFVEGSRVIRKISAIGEEYIPGKTKSLAGYDISEGYLTTQGYGGNRDKGENNGFIVRDVRDLLDEGRFNISTMVAGDAGNLDVVARSAVVSNSFSFRSLVGNHYGILTGSDEYLQASGSILEESGVSHELENPVGYALGTLSFVAEEMEVSSGDKPFEEGKFNLNAVVLGASGQNVVIGESGEGTSDSVSQFTVWDTIQSQFKDIDLVTNTVTVADNTSLSSPNITLQAKDAIILGNNSLLTGKDENGHGTVSLVTPAGTITRKTDARIHAADEIVLEMNQFDYQAGGEFLKLDNSSLTLRGKSVAFLSDQAASSYVVPDDEDGNPVSSILKITSDLMNIFDDIDDLKIQSGSGMYFYGDLNITVEDKLALDADGFVNWTSDSDGNYVSDLDGDVSITANEFELLGGLDFTDIENGAQSGFEVTAGLITIGDGDVSIDNFASVSLKSSSDILFRGIGELNVEGDLQLQAPRVSVTNQVKNDYYFAPDFKVVAGAGNAIAIKGDSGTKGNDLVPGGGLSFDAGSISIENGALVEVFSGKASFSAQNDIVIKGKSRIETKGDALTREIASTEYLDVHGGGMISLSSLSGAVSIQEGSVLDVSNSFDLGSAPLHPDDVANLKGSAVIDAGLIHIASSANSAILDGEFKGAAASSDGKGGSFSLHTERLDGTGLLSFDDLNEKFVAGGLDGDLAVRAETGSLDINDEVNAESLVATADKGSLTFNAKYATPGQSGGYVEMSAGSDLILGVDSVIDVSGFYGQGGTVRLSASNVSGSDKTDGRLQMLAGSKIIVAGNPEDMDNPVDPRDARVWLRAERSGSDEIYMDLNGSIENAGEIIIEAYKTYQTGSWSNNWNTEANTFVTAARQSGKAYNRLTAGLGDYGDAGLYFLPGVEVKAPGSFTLPSNKDLTSWRYDGDVAGVLNIRAGGHLNVSGGFYDNPSGNTPVAYNGLDSWAINLVAGADTGSADVMAIGTGEYDLIFNNNEYIYTESAPLRLAAARDINVGTAKDNAAIEFPHGQRLDFNISTLDDKIIVRAGRDINLAGGVIQSSDGDIIVKAGRKLNMTVNNSVKSAIRTTGKAPALPEIVVPPAWGSLAAGDQMYIMNRITTWNATLVEEGLEYWRALSDNPEDITPFSSLNDTQQTTLLVLGGSFLFQETMDEWVEYSAPSDTSSQYWAYSGGGDLTVTAQDGIMAQGYSDTVDNWDKSYTDGSGNEYLLPNYGSSNPNDPGRFGSAGIVSMGAGNVNVQSGGNIFAPVAAFKAGDIRIYSSGNIDGRFHVADGNMELNAGGNVGKGYIRKTDGSLTLNENGSYKVVLENQAIELYDARAMLTAQGGMEIGSVVNPTYAKPEVEKKLGYEYEHDDSKNTRIRMVAVNGDFTIVGKSAFYSQGQSKFVNVMPPDVAIFAGGNVKIAPDGYTLTLAPSYTGNLQLLSGGNISGIVNQRYSTLQMSGADPVLSYDVVIGDPTDWDLSAALGTPSHLEDNEPVQIVASGDINGLNLVFPKQAIIVSEQDISDFYFQLQNLSESDVTYVKAARDIIFDTGSSTTSRNVGIQISGPGSLFVQAGNMIDLGAVYTGQLGGIRSIGNANNPGGLPEKGSDIYAIAGYYGRSQVFSTQEVENFFNEVRAAGVEFTSLINAGDPQGAKAAVDLLRSEVYPEFFGEQASGSGDIKMISSSINTNLGSASVNIINSGDLDVGQDIERDEGQVQSNGIFTASGGAVNIFSGGDVNVYESRIMTYGGGDITIWSDRGDIFAGRGSKAAINTQAPRIEEDAQGNQRIIFSPPAAGSGVRTLTYDPDGPTGPRSAPPIGDIFITAPEGVIDAGEAGIAGGNLFLGAQAILNTQNISFSGAAIGVTTGDAAAGGVGTLSGAGDVTSSGGLAQQGQAIDSARRRAAAVQESLAQGFAPNWIRVEFMGFINTGG